MFVIKYVYYSSTVSGACVTISGLCELTVIADKRASSVNSGDKDVFVVNLELYNPRTIRFARLGNVML